MRVAINRIYSYITLPEYCPEKLKFEEWVMQKKFATHSIVPVPEWVDGKKLRYSHFDYDAKKNKYEFNADKYNAGIEKQDRQNQITHLESLLVERYASHGRLLATDGAETEIEEVKGEIALILAELEVLYGAQAT